MSIIIRKKETGEVFDVPASFKLEIKNTSPVFDKLGSKSLGASIPCSPHNMRLMGFANCLENANKPIDKMPVTVSSGSYVRDGLLFFNSGNTSEFSFGITIAFNEGIMYEEMSSLKLTQLSNLPFIEKPVDDLIDYMNELFHGDRSQYDLSVFRIALKGQTFDNGVMEETYYPFFNRGSFQNNNTLIVDTYTYIVFNNKQEQIDVPYGYGIMPFVRVWKILELIFGHFGYKVNANPFKTHYQLNGLCVLNNTVDALVLGQLDYAQLLPPVSIMEFLDSLYARFGLKVFFDGNTNEVNIRLLKDIFNNPLSKTLDIASVPYNEVAKPKQLKLSASKNLENSETETETYEEFLKKYNNTIETVGSVGQFTTGGIYYLSSEGSFFQISTVYRKQKLISSIHFDWNKKDEGLETEEITGKDECLTLFNQNGSIYFAVKPNLLNTVMTVNAEDNDMFSEANRLAFAFDLGEYYTLDANGKKQYKGYNVGSIFPHTYQIHDLPVRYEDRQGNKFEYALTFVGEDGAFNRFFKAYDAFLRHSNRPVKFKAHIPLSQLSDPDMDVKVNINGQPLLLEKIDHTLSGDLSTASVEARTLKLYEPHDLAKEQHLPVPLPILYRWYQWDDEPFAANAARDAKEIELRADTVNLFISLTMNRREPEPPKERTDYWFLPPTKEQYEKGTQIGFVSYPMKVYCTWKYQNKNGYLPESKSIVIATSYKTWFEPFLKDW